MFHRLLLGPVWYGARIRHSDGRITTDMFADKLSLGIFLLAHRSDGDIEDIEIVTCRAHSYERAMKKVPTVEPTPAISV